MRGAQAKIARAACALALVALASACGGHGASGGAQQSNAGAQQSPAQSDAGGGASAASPADVARLNEDIEQLEKAAERNPADEDTRDGLAKAYVRRGDAERAGNQPQEALKDYQRALRLDPDNDEAQKNAADTQEQLGGERQEDENGAPAPLPVTPNVADEDDKPAPSEKPTPKKQ
ncbi:MAG TPA: tetratricopeptide repeat protein [Pyrinomonadaceae bacterium]|jgi:tetratricopeptide (TPR) repeat protein|nr:tetratricopeptide repeat protein [Pyrinomonadaceae bacterium]